MNNYFSTNLKTLRKERNLRQIDLANKLEISRSAISYYESGTNEPDLYVLIKISEFFNVSIDTLVFSDLSKQKHNEIFKIPMLDEVNINNFSREELIENLKHSLKYYTDKINELEKEIPKKISELKQSISFLESLTPNINYSIKQSESDAIKIPLIGTIAAGTPILAQSNIEDYISIDIKQSLCQNKNYYALKVKGNSMNKLFNDGEILIVEHTSIVNDSDIAVVLINNSDATVKKIKYTTESILLIPQSFDPYYKVKEYDLKENSIIIQGKVISTLREYLNF